MTQPIPPTNALRRFDEALPSLSPDDSAFAGYWINTSSSPLGWQELRTSLAQGIPTVQAALADGSCIEFTATTLYGGIGGTELTAFSAEYADEDSRILLQGNFNLGLLVLATFKCPAAGGTGYFSREFFARAGSAQSRVSAANEYSGALFEQLRQTESLGHSTLTGVWRNTETNTRGLLEIALEMRDTGLSARAIGAPLEDSDAPIDWGAVEVAVFSCLDETGHPSLAVLAKWQFEYLETRLQLRVPGGTLAVAGFNEFRDGRMDYATREFFHRLPQQLKHSDAR